MNTTATVSLLAAQEEKKKSTSKSNNIQVKRSNLFCFFFFILHMSISCLLKLIGMKSEVEKSEMKKIDIHNILDLMPGHGKDHPPSGWRAERTSTSTFLY